MSDQLALDLAAPPGDDGRSTLVAKTGLRVRVVVLSEDETEFVARPRSSGPTVRYPKPMYARGLT